MKFTIKQAVQQEPEEKTVEASLSIDKDGCLELNINGNTLLWIGERGILHRYGICDVPFSLSGLGFMSNKYGQICTLEEYEKKEGSYR